MTDPMPSVESSGAPAYARDRLPDTLNGKYVLERRLGGGGMAEVFLARTVGAEGFSRPVAIKRVLDGLSRDPRFAAQFVIEAQLSARLQHPNIVSVLDFDRDVDGRLFLVMELVEGVDLLALLQTGPLPFSLVIHLTLEILRGLDYAHELPLNPDGVRGLVHRDISPQNVLLSWEGAIKVSDFGIAKARAATSASGSLMIKGKPSYMSPEQVNGRPLDGRSDLFAVGVMMYEMLGSVHLFAGGTPEEALGRVLYAKIPSVRELRPDVPEELSHVVASLLTRDLDHRMPSAQAAIAALVACADCPKAGREELIEALAGRFAGRAPVRARGVSHAAHSDLTLVARSTQVLAPPVKTSTSDLSAVSKRDHRWIWAVLAAFLVVGVAIVALMMRDSAPQPGSTAQPTASEPPSPEPSKTPPPAPALTSPAAAPSAAAPPAAHDSDGIATPQTPRPATTPAAHNPAPAPARRPPGAPSNGGGIHEIHLGGS